MSSASSCDLSVRVVPNASKDEVVGWLEDELKVKVTTPPEGGRANKRLLAVLAKQLGLPKRAVSLSQGQTSRHKVVHIEGRSLEAIQHTFNQTA